MNLLSICADPPHPTYQHKWHISKHLHAHTCIHAWHANTCTHKQINIHTWPQGHTRMHAQKYIHTYIMKCIYMHTYMYIARTYRLIHTYIYICTYGRTFIHTRTYIHTYVFNHTTSSFDVGLLLGVYCCFFLDTEGLATLSFKILLSIKISPSKWPIDLNFLLLENLYNQSFSSNWNWNLQIWYSSSRLNELRDIYK